MGKQKKQKNVKITNKHLNKLAKRGELRKERKKKRIRLLKLKGEWKPKAMLQESVDKELEAYENIEDEDETLPLDMIDSNDLNSNDSNSGDDGDQSNRTDFEEKRRRFADHVDENDKRRHLLPLKSASGQLIPQSVEEIEMPNEEEEEDEPQQSSTSQTIPKKTETVVEMFANRCRSLKETKDRIASCAHLLLMDPQENVRKSFLIC